jgi:hypothetical protein
MRSLRARRPSASMVVSLVALVVACSGTAVAATGLVNGDNIIRKGTLSGDRLRRHTLTGRQINLRKLGKVPRAHAADTAGSAGYAAHAGSAGSAGSAANATNAINATNAGNAAALGGQPASSYLTTGSRIGTNGIVTVEGTASGATVTLFSHGPFTVTLRCTTSGTDTGAELYATSTVAGSVLNSSIDVPANTVTDLGVGISYGPTSTAAPAAVALEAPSGAQLVVNGAIGTKSLGLSTGCWANFTGIA